MKILLGHTTSELSMVQKTLDARATQPPHLPALSIFGDIVAFIVRAGQSALDCVSAALANSFQPIARTASHAGMDAVDVRKIRGVLTKAGIL